MSNWEIFKDYCRLDKAGCCRNIISTVLQMYWLAVGLTIGEMRNLAYVDFTECIVKSPRSSWEKLVVTVNVDIPER